MLCDFCSGDPRSEVLVMLETDPLVGCEVDFRANIIQSSIALGDPFRGHCYTNAVNAHEKLHDLFIRVRLGMLEAL